MRLKAGWVIGGVVLAVVLASWLGRGRSKPAAADSTPSGKQHAPSVVWSPPRHRVAVPGVESDTNAVEDAGTAMGAASLNNTAATNWQDQLAEMLVSDLEEAEKGRQLLQLFASLPAEGQIQLAEQLSFMLDDQDYPQLAQYLTDTSLPETVLQALLDGLLLRSNETQAPLLLAVAQDEQHPRAAEARRQLETLLGQELPVDQAQWPATVQRWLEASRQQEQPQQ